MPRLENSFPFGLSRLDKSYEVHLKYDGNLEDQWHPDWRIRRPLEIQRHLRNGI